MKITVDLGKSYDIIIEDNLISNVDKYICNKDLFLITDERVMALYKEKILSITTNIVVSKGFEEAKSLKEYERITKELLTLGIERTSTLVAFGGGVIGDLTGFIASTLFRGIDFIQIPTTLLSQVDSSIGGKVGINFDEYKNILGSFYQPSLVLIDPFFLKTLPEREYSCGMAEVIKYCLIKDRKICFLPIKEMIYACLMIKKEFVEKDEFDHNERRILNFGHTFGHAIEKHSNYSYNHGEAVGLGMLAAIKLGIKLGITPNDAYIYALELLKKFKLPIDEIAINDYIEIKKDKKRAFHMLNMVLLEDIEKPLIVEVNEDEILSK